MVRRLQFWFFMQALFFSPVLFSQDNFIETRDISIGNSHTCALTSQGIKCWGDAELPTLKAPVDAITNPRSIAAGNRFSCMIVDEGVRCWGEIPDTSESNILIEQKDLGQPKLLTAGHNHACAVTMDDQIKCWGENLFGETQPPAGLTSITEISAGMNNTCAIAAGKVYCWGIETTNSTAVPEGLKNPRNLTSGWWHHCVYTDDGIRCWGNPYKTENTPDDVKMISQFASGDFYNCALVPEGVKCWDQKGKTKLVEESAGAFKVAVGTATACAITTQKGVICWKLYGDNAYKLSKSYVPSGSIKEIQHVSAGYNSTCVYGDGNKLKCWGANPFGSLDTPDILPGPVSRISHGSKRTCAIRYSQLTCWGKADEKEYKIPDNIGNVSYVAVGGYHVCGGNPEKVRCWGEDEGQVSNVPRRVTNITKLVAGNYHACAEANNQVMCWGGVSLMNGVNPPEPIYYPRAMCAGGTFSCAIDLAGDVKCWGSKAEPPPEVPEGGSGGGGETGELPPSLAFLNIKGESAFAPGSIRNATEIACGLAHACALYENKIKCWDTDGTVLKTPEMVNPRKLSAGANHTCAVTDTGLKCWGGMLNMDMPDYSLSR